MGVVSGAVGYSPPPPAATPAGSTARPAEGAAAGRCRRSRWGLVAALLSFVMLIGAAAAHAQSPAEIGGDFSLVDEHGRPFALTRLRGKLVLLFFGYTFCPDICPTELSNLAAVLDALGPEAERVQGVFVSLDPQRDTPSVLNDFTRYFSQELIGLTGTQEQVAQVAEQYRVRYQRHEQPDGRYSLDHSANLYVIDGRGRLAVVVPYGLPPEHVLELVRRMLDEGV